MTDYVLAREGTEPLWRAGKRKEALTAYVSLAAHDGLTDFQKTDAWECAASCARNLRDLRRADELAARIPLAAVAKTARMENRLARREFAVLGERFGAENWNGWPFRQVGAGAFARGGAYVALTAGKRAEADLQTALAYTSADRSRATVPAPMGLDREKNVNDQDAALAAYRRVFEGKNRLGAADEFRAVEGAARILTRQRRFAQAAALLRRAGLDAAPG